MFETPEDAEAVDTAQVDAIAKQSAQVQSAAKSFAAAAGSGFKIEPEAAATLINSCRDSLNKLQELVKDLGILGQEPQLGTTPGAKVVAPFTLKSATATDGIQPVLSNLQQTLQDMIEAYYKASTNYSETEQLVQEAIKNAAGSVGGARPPLAE